VPHRERTRVAALTLFVLAHNVMRAIALLGPGA
jgi:hypothetical protein